VGDRTAGIVGLGVIGAGVARALSASGMRVVGSDVDHDRARALSDVLEPMSSPRDVIAAADTILIAVHNDEQVRAVLTGDDGLLPGAPADRHIVVLSTISLETIRWAAARAAEAGVSLLDCGVTGGERLTSRGEIVAMLGGTEAEVEAVRPVIEVFGVPTIHTGALGTGMQSKLARNLVLFGSWYVASEAARLVAAAGVDVRRLVEICEAADQGGGMSRPMALFAESETGVPLPKRERLLGFVHKDLRAALALADELGLDMPATNLVESTSDDLLGVGITAREA